jgi:hypothetical protein
MSVEQVSIKWALGRKKPRIRILWREWIVYCIRWAIFGIPLLIQRNKLLGKEVVGYIIKGEIDDIGKCTGVEIRFSKDIFGAPLVYMVNYPRCPNRTLRAQLCTRDISKVLEVSKITWCPTEKFERLLDAMKQQLHNVKEEL